MDFKWNKPIPKILAEATGGPNTMLFMANEAKVLMDPYVPALNLGLAQNVRVYTEDGRGIVHYVSPYAQFQHKGVLMVSRITGSPWASKGESKVVTNKKLKYNKSRHPLATSKWEEAMKAARMADLVNSVQRYIDGGFL